MAEHVETISTLVAGNVDLADAMRAGFEAGRQGDVDSLPSDAASDWAEYYYRGYIEGVECHRSESVLQT